MPTGRTDELTARFGPATAAAITAAYEAAIHSRIDDRSVLMLDTDQRLALVQALIDEAVAGRVDPAHLKGTALIFITNDIQAPATG